VEQGGIFLAQLEALADDVQLGTAIGQVF
jgi:hypothetical protein